MLFVQYSGYPVTLSNISTDDLSAFQSALYLGTITPPPKFITCGYPAEPTGGLPANIS